MCKSKKIVPVTGTILQSLIRFSAERPLNPEPDEQAEQYGGPEQDEPQFIAAKTALPAAGSQNDFAFIALLFGLLFESWFLKVLNHQ